MIYFLFLRKMARKKKQYDPSKKYNFDMEKWEYIEKVCHVEARKNPVAIIYVRVSDQKQIDEGNGLVSQEATCRRWAESKDIKIVKVFEDWGKSGKYLDWAGLLGAIGYLKEQNHKGIKVTHFLCTEISRISRSEDITQTIEMKKRIEATWVDIITTSSGMNISSTNSNDSFMTDLNIIRAKMESIQIGERSKNGTLAKLYSGHWTFHPPVGYERIHIKADKKTEKIIQLQEPKATIVKEGLEMFANGVFQNNSQLLKYFNEKMLESNHHSPKPWKLDLMFIKRMFNIEKLYFYAGFILYPRYDITKPIEAVHQPIITLSTAHKIIKRIGAKGKLKFWPRKDSNDLYPLRGLVSCPHCDYPMTARTSKGAMFKKTGKVYNYYGCNRKDCRQKENINVGMMHNDLLELLETITPKKGVLKMLDLALKETFKEKNKVIRAMTESKKRRINDIEKEINSFSATISKLENITIIQRLEEKRGELEAEKDLLEEEIKDKALNEKDFERLYIRIKNIIEDPVSIWEMWSLEMKIGLVKVLFGEKFYYTKKEKYQTPHLSALYGILSHLNGGNVSSGKSWRTRRNYIILSNT